MRGVVGAAPPCPGPAHGDRRMGRGRFDQGTLAIGTGSTKLRERSTCHSSAELAPSSTSRALTVSREDRPNSRVRCRNASAGP
jgi:hypothetical protein